VTTISGVGVSAGSFSTGASAATAKGLDDNLNVKFTSGTLASLDAGKILIDESTATKQKWSVGSSITAGLGTLKDQALTVGGIYKDNQLLGSMVVNRDLYAKAVPAAEQRDQVVLVKTDPSADKAAVRTSIVGVVKPFLVVTVQDGTEFVNSFAQQIDQLLGLLYALLGLAIVIAVLGIINTLALSVVERTREIGLLRAVGLRRGQLSRMITVEAVLTAVFGAVLGTILGLGLGVATQHALSSDTFNVLSISWTTVIVLLVASAVAGIVSAALPALRAVRMNVLQAIATD